MGDNKIIIYVALIFVIFTPALMAMMNFIKARKRLINVIRKVLT